MYLLSILLLFPLMIALVLLSVKNDNVRSFIIKAAAAIISAGVLAFLIYNFHHGIIYFDFKSRGIDAGMLSVELLLAAYIFYISLKSRRYLVSVLIIFQTAVIVVFRFVYGWNIPVEHGLFVDKLSMLMALIVGIVGGLICVYSVGYMRDYHASHSDVKDLRGFFFFVVFVFISAMFGLVFSNNLMWIFFCWEITTLSSFFLIGYDRSEDARRNAFRALEYNLWGGIAFALAIFYLYYTAKTLELDRMMAMGKSVVMLPVAFIAFAGITKSAQYPFCKWLLGAMVAPTPVSALLHSSTMVKAGVYIILRFAQVMEGTVAGYLIASVGGLTFLVGSLIAITQDDAKKVLAYSTVANLGLVILCAGIGTYESVWAAILLIIFHAVTKCLLFLLVGVVDDKLHSRHIEDMCGLIITMPKVSIMMQVGIAGMFLAPFGMFISKWAVIKALVDSNPVLLIFVAFGGAATFFFWVKWMGKLTLVERITESVETQVAGDMWFPLYALTVMTVLLVGFLPVISKGIVDPYVVEIYHQANPMGHGNVVIMLVMLTLVVLFPLSFVHRARSVKVSLPYLAGANTGSGGEYAGAMGRVVPMETKDYYLENYFGEDKLYKWGVVASLVLIAGFFAVAVII